MNRWDKINVLINMTEWQKKSYTTKICKCIRTRNDVTEKREHVGILNNIKWDCKWYKTKIKRQKSNKGKHEYKGKGYWKWNQESFRNKNSELYQKTDIYRKKWRLNLVLEETENEIRK